MLSDLMNQILRVKRVILRLKKMYPSIYRCLFSHVSQWGKVFLGHIASCDGCRSCSATVWPLCQIGFKALHYSRELDFARAQSLHPGPPKMVVISLKKYKHPKVFLCGITLGSARPFSTAKTKCGDRPGNARLGYDRQMKSHYF